jgi:hypothetical protein
MAALELPAAAIEELDKRLTPLVRGGIKLSGPGGASRIRAEAAELRRNMAQVPALCAEADALLPPLVAAYRTGDDRVREDVRGLLSRYSAFRWAVGRSVMAVVPPLDRQAALEALALFSMKDGGRDWRDQQVWLDRFCKSALDSGLDLPYLLRQGAALSSDVPRFASAASTRTLLLRYAERFAALSAPRPS